MTKKKIKKHNILVINITRLGDMLQATPTLAGMKMENPDARITVIVEKQFASVCSFLPNIDEVIPLDMGCLIKLFMSGPQGIIEAYEFLTDYIEDLKAKNFDYCINMSSSAYTAILMKILNIKNNGGWIVDEEGNRIINSDWSVLFASSVFHQNRRFSSFNLVDTLRGSSATQLHPLKLQAIVSEESKAYARSLLAEANFSNTGPLIAVQAGASQRKRQWASAKFIEMINILIHEHNCRIVMTGTKNELKIINPIIEGVNSNNLFVSLGKTNIPQLSGLLSLCDLLVTGDTGTMHMSIAVGTPVVAMFVASAFLYETGPYGEGNIVVRPLIGCHPCNPGKICTKLDCHNSIKPALMADLAIRRVKSDFKELPKDYVDPKQIIIYRSTFDKFNFGIFQAITSDEFDLQQKYRMAYRKMWLDEFEGLCDVELTPEMLNNENNIRAILGIGEIIQYSDKGIAQIDTLIKLVQNPKSTAAQLKEINEAITELDRVIEQVGYQYYHLELLVQMFRFCKENMVGTEVLDLASQMKRLYQELKRRVLKLAYYYSI